MGTCRTCQKDAGWRSHECADCRSRREAAEEAAAAEAEQAAERERRATIDAMTEEAMAKLQETTDAGGTAMLYECVALEVDNGWLDESCVETLRDLGERGWAVAGMSPHVVTSTNLDRAISVVAVEQLQVLVGLAVTSMNLMQLEPEIRHHYERTAAAKLDRESAEDSEPEA